MISYCSQEPQYHKNHSTRACVPASSPQRGLSSFFACGIPEIFFFAFSIVCVTFPVNFSVLAGTTPDGLFGCESYLFKKLRQMIFLGRGLVISSSLVGIIRDSAIGVESANCAVGFLEELAALLEKRLDLGDQLLFVKLLFRLALCFVDSLCGTDGLAEVSWPE
jgi:hypothetical protein